MAKLTGKLNHSAHTDIYTYIYQKTYNYNASNTGYDVPDTSKTWSDWKLIGGTAYNNEIETFLANALNKNTEQDTKIKNLEKKTLHTNAYTDDFLAIDDFALDPSIKNLTGANRQNAIANALNAWLNNVMFENTENEIKKLGRCRLLCDGINLECYNYIISFDNKSGIQTISGPCDLTSDNKIIHTSLTYNQIYRTRENGNWNNWRKK